MQIGEGKIIFGVVKHAIKRSGSELCLKDPTSMLIWYDTLREMDFYSDLKPWQVVNRIPGINMICRKASFIQAYNRIQLFFPTLYNFIPKSLVLPIRNKEFQNILSQTNGKYIVKPDGGSLGSGITIIEPGNKFTPKNSLAIAQEYVDSYLINDTKFDLRIYALISSVSPLKIHVYRDGIARFCSERSSQNTIYSQLTNTAINKQKSGVKIESITKTVKEVFQNLKKSGINTQTIWSKIDNQIILTILSIYNFLDIEVKQKCPPNGYNRCFQLLGFDFILSKNLDPLILEVNYRPSLQADIKAEFEMKINMLAAVIHIGSPFRGLQKLILSNKDLPQYNIDEWNNYFNNELSGREFLDKDIDTGNFDIIYPSSNQNNMKTYNQVMNLVLKFPITLTPTFRLPVSLKKPTHEGLFKVHPIQIVSAIPKENSVIMPKQALQAGKTDKSKDIPKASPSIKPGTASLSISKSKSNTKNPSNEKNINKQSKPCSIKSNECDSRQCISRIDNNNQKIRCKSNANSTNVKGTCIYPETKKATSLNAHDLNRNGQSPQAVPEPTEITIIEGSRHKNDCKTADEETNIKLHEMIDNLLTDLNTKKGNESSSTKNSIITAPIGSSQPSEKIIQSKPESNNTNSETKDTPKSTQKNANLSKCQSKSASKQNPITCINQDKQNDNGINHQSNTMRQIKASNDPQTVERGINISNKTRNPSSKGSNASKVNQSKTPRTRAMGNNPNPKLNQQIERSTKPKLPSEKTDTNTDTPNNLSQMLVNQIRPKTIPKELTIIQFKSSNNDLSKENNIGCQVFENVVNMRKEFL